MRVASTNCSGRGHCGSKTIHAERVQPPRDVTTEHMRREPAPSRGERWLSRLGAAARTELFVLRTTFFVAWLVLAVALALALSIENARNFEGLADAAIKLALAGALGVYYAAFPATLAALGRLSWRLFDGAPWLRCRSSRWGFGVRSTCSAGS